MRKIHFTIITILIIICEQTVNAYRIRRNSEIKNITLPKNDKNVTKRDSDFFPDWVPFKNKQGDELGEFVSVKKTKLKKRLAPPKHFILKAVADSEDYYDKDQGGGDNEDYFDKKDWTDINRAADSYNDRRESNNTELVDIEGIRTIVQHKPAKKMREPKGNRHKTNKSRKTKTTTSTAKPRRYEEDSDYEDNSSSLSEPEKHKSEVTDEKRKEVDEEKKRETEEEKRENEEKRRKILESVDKLKALHAAEQNILIEKAKEEEMFREEQQRLFTAEPPGKYDPQGDGKLSTRNTYLDDYEERGETDKYVHDKYSEVHESPVVSSTEVYKTRRTTKKTTPIPRTRITVDTGKLSVFRNPQAYMVYDYVDSSDEVTTKRTTTTTKQPKPKGKSKERIRLKTTNHESRLSLVPVVSNTNPDEPKLFFPKPKKSRKNKKPGSSTERQNYKDNPVSRENYDVTRPPLTDSVPSAADTAPSAVDSTSTNKAVYIDTDPESTSHQNYKADKIKEEKKHDNHEHEKGEGKEYKSHHEEDRGEHGNKAYEGFHKDQRSSKGYHDKDDHLGKYDDRGGFDKKHHDESGHFGEHEHVEEGKKHAQYEESGKHSKGHSTKGSHDIDKKEEYEKNVVFFEEEGDSAEIEKHGGFKETKKHERRGEFAHGKIKSGHEARGRGETGKFQKGGHSEQSKNLKSAAGHDRFGRQFAQNTNSGSSGGGKHWIYHHGNPAKTASLAVIDRRKDLRNPSTIFRLKYNSQLI